MFDNTIGIVVYVWYDRIVGTHPLLSFMINTIIRYYIYINRLTLLSDNYLYKRLLYTNHGKIQNNH